MKVVTRHTEAFLSYSSGVGVSAYVKMEILALMNAMKNGHNCCFITFLIDNDKVELVKGVNPAMNNFLIGMYGKFDDLKYKRDFRPGFWGVEACMFPDERKWTS